MIKRDQQLVGVRHPSLRCPRSYPNVLLSAEGVLKQEGKYVIQGKNRFICDLAKQYYKSGGRCTGPTSLGNKEGEMRDDPKVKCPGGMVAGKLENSAISPMRVQNSGQDMETSVRLTKAPKYKASPTTNITSLGPDSPVFRSMGPVVRPTSCHFCGLYGSRKCSQCRQTYYCSVECQRQDWSAHTVICKPSAQKEQSTCKSPSKVEERKPHCKVESPPVGQSQKEPEIVKKITFLDLQDAGLNEGSEIQGFVLDYSSPSEFFVQVYNAKSMDSLLKVSALLKDTYTRPENLKKGYTPAVGEVCVAKYSQDQNWYRVLVQNVDETMRIAQVLYLDYGNRESVKLDDLQHMHKDVELLPPTSIKCFLANVVAPACGWTPECLVDVKKLLLGQQLSFTVRQVVREEPPCYAVDVCIPASGSDINKMMVEKGYASCKERETKMSSGDSDTVPLLAGSTGTSSEKQGQTGKDPTSRPQAPVLKAVVVSVGDMFNAAITEIQNPESFFCQQLQNAKQLAELMESMSTYHSTTPPSPGFSPAAGDMCSAQFTEDNCWYRASILENVSSDSALVGYVDFGNVEVLPFSRIRPIPYSMLTFPIQAIQCRLAGVKPTAKTWTQEATSLMASVVANKIITVRVVGQTEESLVVELLDGSVIPEVVVSKHLIEAGVAAKVEAVDMKGSNKEENRQKGPLLQESTENANEKQEQTGEDPKSLPQVPVLKAMAISVGDTFDAAITEVQNPGRFYCQQLQNAKQLAELMESMSTYHSTTPPSPGFTPVAGDMCIAQFTEDNRWYRASILEKKSNESALVGYVDFGNVEILPVSRLRPISPNMLTIPIQAVLCSLAGVKPVSKTWSQEATSVMASLVANKMITVQVVGQTEECLMVDLLDRSMTPELVVSKHLIEAGVAVKVETFNAEASTKEEENNKNDADLLPTKWAEIPLGQAVDVAVCMLINPGEFYCQLCNETGMKSLDEVNSLLGLHCLQGSPGAYNPKKGDVCAAAFSGDGNWYRAMVMDIAQNGAWKVRYLDYGNTEEVATDKLRLLPSKFLALPFQAVRCSLSGVKPVGENWDQESIKTFQKFVVGVKLKAKAVSKSKNGFCVELLDSAMGSTRLISDLLVAEGKATRTEAQEGGTTATSCSPGQKATNKTENSPKPDVTDRENLSIKKQLLSPVSPVHSERDKTNTSPLKDQAECASSLPKEDSPGKSRAPESPVEKGEAGVARQWKSIVLPRNEPVQARVLCVISPDLFYAFPKENRVNIEKLQQVMVEMARHCNADTTRQSFKPAAGDACCARFTGDNQWYRAVVLNTSESAANVAYCDFGNVESLPFSRLLPANQSFLEPPVPITRCRLAGVSPVSESWSSLATERLRALLMGCDLTITAVALTNGTYSVTVERPQDSGVLNVNKKMISEDLARDGKPTPRASTCKEREECCCTEFRRRAWRTLLAEHLDSHVVVEKLEEILLHIVTHLKLNDQQK